MADPHDTTAGTQTEASLSPLHFMGAPCRNGHHGLRLKSDGKCVACKSAVHANWRRSNKDHVNAANRLWSKQNRKKVKIRTDRWKRNNPERHRAQNKASNEKFMATPEGVAFYRANAARQRAMKKSCTPKWANLKALRAFYRDCPPGFEVDHIIPLRGKTVSGLHVLENLQYLPKLQNRQKSNKLDHLSLLEAA